MGPVGLSSAGFNYPSLRKMNRLLTPVRGLTTSVRCAGAVTKAPNPTQVTPQTAKFDEVTHTGQAWDQSDYRLQRFELNPKMVNPNVAMRLIAERPPKDCGHDSVIFCDGGHPATGHPRVFINLDKPGVHACGYCGNRFYNSHVTKGEDMSIQHLNC